MTTIIELQNAPLLRRVLSFIIDYVLLLPLIIILYQFWKESLWEGQSIGNRIAKIKIVNAVTGEKPSKKRIFFRNFVFIFTLTLGSITIFINDGDKNLGDLLMNNIVIRKPEI